MKRSHISPDVPGSANSSVGLPHPSLGSGSVASSKKSYPQAEGAAFVRGSPCSRKQHLAVLLLFFSEFPPVKYPESLEGFNA